MEQRTELLRRFSEASSQGDLERLVALLSKEAVFHSDGGGKAPALPNPIYGAETIARGILEGLRKRVPKNDPAATRMGKIAPPRYGPVDDLARGAGTAKKLHPMARYGTAKMYAMITAYELDRKLRKLRKPITVNSWSPGVVPTTQAGREMNPIMKKIMTSRWFVNFMGSHLATEEEAAQALVVS